MSDKAEYGGQPPVRQQMLIYDANCRLCVMAKGGLEKLGRAHCTTDVRFLPYQSDEAARYLGADYVVGRPEAAFLVGGGERHKGLDAFLPLLPGIKGGAVIGRFLRISWVKPLAYLLYRLIARYRYQLFGQVRASNADNSSRELDRTS